MQVQRKWYVFTGGPGSGKTTTINALSQMGYPTVPEVARYLYDNEIASGRSLKEVRQNMQQFQASVLAMQYDIEQKLKSSCGQQRVFLDRGLIDSEAYHNFHNIPLDENEMFTISQLEYRKVFIFEPLPFPGIDGLRTESVVEALQIEQRIKEVCRKYHLEVINVPHMSVDERVKFILDNL